jgi:hypothetical protein
MSSEIQTVSALSNLQNMRKFCLTYRDRLPEKCQIPSGKLVPKQKTRTPSGRFTKAVLTKQSSKGDKRQKTICENLEGIGHEF